MPYLRNLDQLLLVPSGGTGQRVKIAEQILGSSQANISIINIPQTYSHLEILFMGRSDRASDWDEPYIRFNGDTGANYDRQSLRASGSSPSASEGLGGTAIWFGECTGATSPVNVASVTSITISDYNRNVWQKSAITHCGHKTENLSGYLWVYTHSGFWRNTAAITSMTLFPWYGPNFVSGTIATLYGIID